MKSKLTSNQKMWADIFRCSVERSNLYFPDDLDRHQREHTTAILALQKGDHFWKEFL